MVKIKKIPTNAIDDILVAARDIYPKAKFNKDDTEDQARMLNMCLRGSDVSVFTHAYTQINIVCSFCVVQELISHNIHVTVCSSSLDSPSTEYIVPEEFIHDEELKIFFFKYIKKINSMIEELKLLKKDINYHCILPGCIKTEILVSVNFLELLRLIRLEKMSRTSKELKEICGILFSEFERMYPVLFNRENLKYKV